MRTSKPARRKKSIIAAEPGLRIIRLGVLRIVFAVVEDNFKHPGRSAAVRLYQAGHSVAVLDRFGRRLLERARLRFVSLAARVYAVRILSALYP